MELHAKATNCVLVSKKSNISGDKTYYSIGYSQEKKFIGEINVPVDIFNKVTDDLIFGKPVTLHIRVANSSNGLYSQIIDLEVQK